MANEHACQLDNNVRSLTITSDLPTAVPKQRNLTRAAPAVVLLVVNLVPAVGVLFAGWSLLDVVALYWFENVVIGAINILKMLTCAPNAQTLRKMESGVDQEGVSHKSAKHSAAQDWFLVLGHHAMKALLIPFFVAHYGAFCTGHGLFIFGLLGGKWPQVRGDLFTELQPMLIEIVKEGTRFAALALIGSHLFSYAYYFLYRGEFLKTSVGHLMVAPYARIVILHIAILLGAFAIHALGQPIVMLLLLVAGKTVLDWNIHVRAHRKMAGKSAAR